ncbi:MAG: DUF87 domain-containing protein [Chloroflexota bacterium]|nr:DUF87 domain-containing protein [Chloroflexota bacterium]
MPFIEAPTTFYMGRRYDPQEHTLTDEVVYYDSRDLTTHAVVVGMTGSGKTGLCISLLEEAVLDNIPAIVIDPKGDITNLMLTFPDFKPEDFIPWVNVDDARRARMSVEDFAADTAHRWKEGLASWGMVPDRVRWLKYAARYSIYTPGSDAGLPVSILASLRAPREGWQAGNEEMLREKINGITTALLALVGRNAQPIQDREHVLIANIFEYNWRQGIDLNLESIILQIQKPPFSKLGVFPLDEYISEKARMKLAMEMNSIVAAPSFQSWINGDPMDIQSLLYQPDGKARVSVFYIAHLSEAERQFVITLLLENMHGWMRSLSGTTSLRCLLYIDEMFGYFPPFPRNPPTKEPILRLLKQARAFGIGLVLATQNPADLDYKGLSNAGTWFIGRLQSDQDKERVAAGLQSLATVSNEFNLREVQTLISDIEPRVFLMHNVHDQGGPVFVHTRWAMSYLRGPLTRQQVQVLMADQKAQMLAAVGSGYAPGTPAYVAQMQVAALQAQASVPLHNPKMPTSAIMPPPTLPEMPPNLPEMPSYGQGAYGQSNFGMPAVSTAAFNSGLTIPNTPAVPMNVTQATVRSVGSAPPGYSANPPPLSGATTQYYLPAEITSQQALGAWEQRTNFSAQSFGGAVMAYKPVLLAQATVRYQDAKRRIYTARTYAYRLPDVERAGLVHWEDHVAPPMDPRRLSGVPLEEGALYGDLPPGLTDSKRITALSRELADVLYTTALLKIPHNPTLDVYGNPDEDFSVFRSNAQQAAREQRDAEIDKVTQKYQAALDKIEDKLRTRTRQLEGEKAELSERRREELFTTGEAVLSLLNRRTAYTLSRMSRASLYRKQTKADIAEYEGEIRDLEAEATQVQEEFQGVVREVNERWAAIATQVQDFTIQPYKKDISIDLFGIGWLPYWYANVNGQPVTLPALNGA